MAQQTLEFENFVGRMAQPEWLSINLFNRNLIFIDSLTR
jgi:hypothetical protein